MPVLITGDPGTGRTLAARAIHGAEAAGNFVHVRCGADAEVSRSDRSRPDSSADEVRIGRTMFLHGVDALDLAEQRRLVGLLDDWSRHPHPVRVIASTTSDLAEAVRSGAFRVELLQRLNTIVIRVPPLAERGRADFDELVAAFIAAHPRKLTLRRRAAAELYKRRSAASVRELRNVIDRLAVVAESATIDVATIDQLVPASERSHDGGALQRLVDAVLSAPAPPGGRSSFVERALIERALALAPNPTAAARMLGVTRCVMLRRQARLQNGLPADEIDDD